MNNLNVESRISAPTYHYEAEQKQKSNNSYIDIPEGINNFKDLVKSDKFPSIQEQYINDLGKLDKLYYHFTGKSIGLKDKIKLYLTANEKIPGALDGLFQSYFRSRKAVANLVEYLTEFKNKHEQNMQTAIICSELADCNVCLEGFNTKIMLLNENLLYYKNNNFVVKIKTKIECWIKDELKQFALILEQHRKGKDVNQVHWFVRYLNTVHTDYNIELQEDQYTGSKLSIPDSMIKEKFNLHITKYDYCKFIANEFCDYLQDALNKMGKKYWIDNNKIASSEVTLDDTNYIDNLFICLLKEYLGLEYDNSNIGVSNFIEYDGESATYSLSMNSITDYLHLLIATHVDKSPNALNRFKTDETQIITTEDQLNIVNVNNGYFYLLNDGKQQALNLQHLYKLNFSSINPEICSAIFIQALENTTCEKEIYIFLNSKYNEETKVLPWLSKAIKNNVIIKNRVLSAITDDVLKSTYKAYDSLQMSFIKNNILVVEIIQKLLANNADTSYIFQALTSKQLQNVMLGLNNSEFDKIITVVSEFDEEFKNFFYQLAYYCYEIKIQIVSSILQSNLRHEFIGLLTEGKQEEIFQFLIESAEYKPITYFMYDKYKRELLNVVDENILHLIVINNDIATLNDIEDIYLTESLLSTKNKAGFTPLMLAAKNDSYSCLQKLLSVYSLKSLEITNKNHENALMIAIRFSNDKSVEALIEKSNNHILLQQNITDGYNALQLAIKLKRPYITKLIKKCPKSALLATDKKGYNSLMLAVLCGATNEVIDFSIAKCPESALSKQYQTGYIALMLAIQLSTINGKLDLIGSFFGHKDIHKYLEMQDATGNRVIDIAAKSPACLSYVNELMQPLEGKVIKNKLNFNQQGEAVIRQAIRDKDHSHLQQLLENSKPQVLVAVNDSDKLNFLMYAITVKNNDDCVKIILKYATQTILDHKNINGHTALQMAIILKRPYADEIIKKSNPTAMNDDNLLLAIKCNASESTVGLLRNKNPSKDLIGYGECKNTLLMLAACNGSLGAIQSFVTGKDSAKYLEQQNNNGENAMMFAAKYNQSNCLQELIKHATVDGINQVDKYKDNILIRCIVYDHDDTAQQLFKKAGATAFNQINGNLYSPLMIAIHKNKPYAGQMVAKTSTAVIMSKNKKGYDCIVIAILSLQDNIAIKMLTKIKNDLTTADFDNYITYLYKQAATNATFSRFIQKLQLIEEMQIRGRAYTI